MHAGWLSVEAASVTYYNNYYNTTTSPALPCPALPFPLPHSLQYKSRIHIPRALLPGIRQCEDTKALPLYSPPCCDLPRESEKGEEFFNFHQNSGWPDSEHIAKAIVHTHHIHIYTDHEPFSSASSSSSFFSCMAAGGQAGGRAGLAAAAGGEGERGEECLLTNK
jgi:hypothetical protein